MLNAVCLMGRLAADPELKHTQNQIPVTSFRIAVDRTYQPKGQEKQTDWIDIVAWRNTAEFVTRYFHKGSMIAVQGSIQTRSYTDRDGNKRTAFEVVADNVFFGAPAADTHAAGTRPAEAKTPDDFEEIVGDSDPLPF
jgi:single-strand DNA-binding protein